MCTTVEETIILNFWQTLPVYKVLKIFSGYLKNRIPIAIVNIVQVQAVTSQGKIINKWKRIMENFKKTCEETVGLVIYRKEMMM